MNWLGGVRCVRQRLLACSLLLASALVAAGPAPYGEKFVRVGETWPDAGTVLASGDVAPVSARDGSDFRQQLIALERAGGPYADSLAEPLADLGRQLWQNGEVAQAQRLYQRALHVVRVNDGLYSKRQLPILRDLLQSYRGAGQLEALDDRYDYYFRLYGSGQAPYSEVRLRAALEYLRWQREAIRLGLDREDKDRLLFTYSLNRELLEGTAPDASVPPAWYRQLVFSQLRNLYLIENRVAPKIETIGAAPNMPLIGSEWTEQDVNENRLQIIQRGSLVRGRALLEDLIARTAPDNPVELARAYLALADWYQWNGSRQRAAKSYARVERVLQGAEQQELLQQWLAEPVELPDNGAFWQPKVLTGNKRRVVVQARYDVSALGRVKNIETTVADPVDEKLAARLKQRLARTRFRPSFVNGQPEAKRQLARAYELFD